MTYHYKFPASVIISAEEEGLSFFLDKECTQPLMALPFGPVLEDGKTAWFEFYVKNNSQDSFSCLAPTVYPKGPDIFIAAMFTPGLIVGNTNVAFEPGEVGWMNLQAIMPGAVRGGTEQNISFEVEIRADEVLL